MENIAANRLGLAQLGWPGTLAGFCDGHPCCDSMRLFYTVWSQSVLVYKMSSAAYTVTAACCCFIWPAGDAKEM